MILHLENIKISLHLFHVKTIKFTFSPRVAVLPPCVSFRRAVK